MTDATEGQELELISTNVDVDTTTSENVVEQVEYIIHRPSDFPKDLTISSVPPELLAQSLIDLIPITNFSPQLITSNQLFDVDFLTHALTDEDHKVAAALFAVQRINVSDIAGAKAILSALNVCNDKGVLNPIVSSYLHALQQNATVTKMPQILDNRLPSGTNNADEHLDKETDINMKFFQPLQQQIIESEPEEVMEQTSGTSVGPAISSDSIDCDNFDQEYEETHTSKKSLPHKKRIANKLKRALPSTPTRYLHAKCYKCIKCGEQFLNQSSFAEHRLQHAVRKTTYSCEICGKICASQLHFFEHLKSHYEPQLNAAPSLIVANSITDDRFVKVELIPSTEGNSSMYSDATTSTDVVANGHSSENSSMIETPLSPSKLKTSAPVKESRDQALVDGIPMTCPLCGKIFRRKKALDCHMSLSHPRKEEIEEFSEPEDMMEGIRHVVNMVPAGDEDDHDDWKLSTNENYKVNEILPQNKQCSPTPSATDSTTKPTDVVTKSKNSDDHKTRKQFVCSYCNRMFMHRNSLFYHIRSHTGQRPYQCPTCGKSFYAAGALKIHKRLHSGERPYKCEFCDHRFRQWGDLKYHTASIHSDTKMYQCEYCGKDFARKYSLVIHRRIHTGEKNYVCEFCTKTFRAASYLQNHRRIHTGEKPYICGVCSKPFRMRSDLKRHMRIHGDVNTVIQEEFSTNDSENKKRNYIRLTNVESFPKVEKPTNGPESKNDIISTDTDLNSTEGLPLNLDIKTDDSSIYTNYSRPTDTVSTTDRDGNTLYVWITE